MRVILRFFYTSHLFLSLATGAQTLQENYSSPYKAIDFTEITTILPLFTQQPSDAVLKMLNNEKCLIGEKTALLYEFSRYNLSAQPQHTNGSSGYAEAERPFLAMIYTGLSICNLAQKFPDTKEMCQKQVEWLLQAIQTPAVSGFMTPHFGSPFSSQQLNQTSVFVHGHFLYLSLYYRNTFGATDYDSLIHKIAEALHRDFLKQPLLPSYPGMWYPSDNLPALAALRGYDKAFQTSLSQQPIEAFLAEIKAHYLDAYSGLISTYVNPISKQQITAPEGVSVMYGLVYLAEIDSAFAQQQWRQAKKFMLRECTQLVATSEEVAPFATMLSGYGEGLFVCLEYPEREGMTDVERNKINGDSGPIFLGAGTAASGFALTAARVMGDEETATGLEKLAITLGTPAWIGEKLYYIHMIHPAGQAVVFFGKTLPVQGTR